MLVTRERSRLLGIASVVVLGLVVGGCAPAKAQPTPIMVFVTEAPAPSLTAAPSPTATPTATPTAAPTSAAESPSASATPAAPSLGAAVPSTSCTGNANNQSFWAQAAAAMRWNVYCPVLPDGWGVSATGGTFDYSGGGSLKILYSGPSGATLEIDEGAYCTTDADSCSPHSAVLGTAIFGDQQGSLDAIAGGGFAVYVSPGTAEAYALIGTGMSQDSLVAYAAAMARVARS